MNPYLLDFFVAFIGGILGSLGINRWQRRRAARKATGSPRTPGQFLRGI
jgi:hypothetical protein